MVKKKTRAPEKEKAKADRKSIGLNLGPPEKVCQDSKCPWHGRLPIRGRVFRGTVKSARAYNTVAVEWGYHRKIRKYDRYERRKSRVSAYNPPCIRAKEGDSVVIAECRPLSKTKAFVVVGIEAPSSLAGDIEHGK